MPDPDELQPRPLWSHETPARGDIHFAVGFGPHSAFVSRVIAAGTASRTNHTGIITEVTPPQPNDPGQWRIVESLAHGVVEDTHDPPPNSTVIRVSDDESLRGRLAARAETLCNGDPHIDYDWWSIARIVYVGLIGRVPFLTFPILAAPPLARYVSPVWIPIVVTAIVIVVLYRIRGLLFRLAMNTPWPRRELRTHMICSAFVRYTLQSEFGGAGALPGLAREEVAMTSPGDLMQELLHRCDYWRVDAAGRPTRWAILDAGSHDRASRTGGR
jgi:hypothetical protein